jgi:hypothetical protein
MSEFGCITNGRTFQEIGTLYSTNMTGVFSGGLVYEYSQEGNGYGLVTISGNTVTPNSQFTDLENEYKDTPNPTGNGGAMTSSVASTCPPASDQWDVANDNIPATPSAAETYMKNGAGPGPGLNGPGSQTAGNSENESSGTVSGSSTGSATTTASGSSSSSTGSGKSAASSLRLDISIMSMVSLGLAAVMVVL